MNKHKPKISKIRPGWIYPDYNNPFGPPKWKVWAWEEDMPYAVHMLTQGGTRMWMLDWAGNHPMAACHVSKTYDLAVEILVREMLSLKLRF